MSTPAAEAAVANPAVTAALAAVAEPAAEPAPAAKADAKPESKAEGAKVEPGAAAAAEPEKPKEDWDKVLKFRRRAEQEIAAKKAEVAKAVEEANARAKAAEAAAAEVAPLLEALKAKDFRKVLELTGGSMQSVVDAIADEGKAPTPEEIEARAVEKAKAALAEENKKREEAEAERRKKEADEAEAAEVKRFEAAKQKHLGRIEAALLDGKEKFTAATLLDGVLSALGNEGSAVAKAALDLTLKIHEKTQEMISPTEALERVQKAVLPSLQSLAELVAAQTKQPEKKTSGREVQPTLSDRVATGPAVTPDEEEDDVSSPVVSTDEVLKIARKALPHLRQQFGG